MKKFQIKKVKKTMLAQLIVRVVMFLLFLLSVFIIVPSIRYLFIVFIIVNLVLGFINKKRSIFMNIVFILLFPSLFIPIWEYLITIILLALTGIHVLMFCLWYQKD